MAVVKNQVKKKRKVRIASSWYEETFNGRETVSSAYVQKWDSTEPQQASLCHLLLQHGSLHWVSKRCLQCIGLNVNINFA